MAEQPEPLIAQVLARLLASGAWPGPSASTPRIETEALCDAARREGIAAVLFDALRGYAARDPRAAALREALAPEARRMAALEMLNRAELARVLPRLVAAGHRFLLLKGTPLAYTLYPDPAQRPRCDTDLLVPPGAAPAVVETLRAFGYREHAGVRGELVSQQTMLSRQDGRGNAQVFDLHWRISNRPGLAEAVGFEELWARSRELPALGPGVRAPGDLHALLVACLHLAGHHPGEERLIWLYDLHLLAGALAAMERTEFVALCRRKGLVDFCAPVLSLAADAFPSPALAELCRAFAVRGAPSGTARSRPSRLQKLGEDLRALPGWRARLRLLKELAFPDAAYLRARYAVRSDWSLPYYYAKRILRGAGRWLKR